MKEWNKYPQFELMRQGDVISLVKYANLAPRDKAIALGRLVDHQSYEEIAKSLAKTSGKKPHRTTISDRLRDKIVPVLEALLNRGE